MKNLILKTIFALLCIPIASNAKSSTWNKNQPTLNHSKGKMISTNDPELCRKLNGHATRTDGQSFKFGEYNGKAYICDKGVPILDPSNLGIKKQSNDN